MNKSIKIIVTIITVVILIILLGIMVFISYNNKILARNKININDIGIKNSANNNTNENKEDKIALEKLPQEYSMIEAINDKCVINVHGGTIYNKDVLDRFIDNIKKKKQDYIRCINYTVEGDMIITDVEFAGKDNFKVLEDSTRDKFGVQVISNYKFKKLEVEEDEDGKNIILKEKVEGNLDEFYLTYYNKDAKVINDYKNNCFLRVVSSNDKKLQKITAGELDKKYDYDIYYYGIDNAIIKIDGEKIELKEALKTNKITMEDIIKQAEKDSQMNFIQKEVYKDGGSKEYNYHTYKIIKRHAMKTGENGYVEDVYIGTLDMNINSINET